MPPLRSDLLPCAGGTANRVPPDRSRTARLETRR
jgi:hypothetical protein